MSKLKIEIELGADCWEGSPREEVIWHLEVLKWKIWDARENSPLREIDSPVKDINGNTVGRFILTSKDSE